MNLLQIYTYKNLERSSSAHEHKLQLAQKHDSYHDNASFMQYKLWHNKLSYICNNDYRPIVLIMENQQL